MTTCQVCAAKSDLFLCSRHVTDLQALFTDLPWWLARLSEAAVGQVKLGGGGRGSSRRAPFTGEDEVLAKCTCGHREHDERSCDAVDREVIDGPDDGTEIRLTACTCTDYRPVASQTKLRAQFLAAGRVNARASKLLDEVGNTLTTWVRHIAETRGITFVRPGFIGPLQAGHVRMSSKKPLMMVDFLREHVHAIACDEAAGECFGDFVHLVNPDPSDTTRLGAIDKLINRPLPMRFLGPCRTLDENTRQRCGTELHCREGVLEVTCPQCRHTYNADHLQMLSNNDLERERMTVDQILQYNRRLPEEYQIPSRTLREWRQKGFLKPHGYRRPNGREVINRHSEDDEPLYLWADVRKLRISRPERKARAG